MLWIGKYVGTHRTRHFFAEIMKQRFDIHIIFKIMRVKQGFRGTQLETMKSCDFLFLAPHRIVVSIASVGCLGYGFLRMWPWSIQVKPADWVSAKHWTTKEHKTKYMSSVHSFSWKSSQFHVKRFAGALDLKKRQTATRKWIKSAYEPSGPSDRRLS